MPQIATPARRNPLWPILGITLAVALAALAFITLAGGPSPPQQPNPVGETVTPGSTEATPPQALVPPIETAARRQEEAAFRTLKGAREFSQANPKDLAGKIARYEEAVRSAQGTPFFEDARRELRTLEGECLSTELSLLDGPVAEACAREEFAGAIGTLELAKNRRSAPDWTAAIDRKIREVEDSARAAFRTVQEGALEARRKGNEEEVKKLRDRVGRWGVPALVTGLETALAGVAPSIPPPPAVRPYDLRWKKALAHAAARDYAAAIGELEEFRRTNPEEAVADLEALRQAGAFHTAMVKTLLGTPKGERLSLKVRDEEGKLHAVEGSALRIDERRIELRQEGGTVAVELGEIAGESLARIDPKGAAILSLIERDEEGSRRCLADLALPEKYRLYAREAFGTNAREREAGKLFHAALRDFQEPAARAECARKCKLLLTEFAETAVVRRNQKSILQRTEAGKDYFLCAADLAASGTFKPSSHPKAGPCWISTEDVDGERSKETFVEFAFAALPETDYRSWVFVGGCCAETFTFHVQATDLTCPHPKDAKQTVPAEPGATYAVLARHEIRYLKPSHAGHGGPKEPKRWEWVAIKLPKYEASGLKKVRLLTEQKGFSVAFAVVSSVRTGPPGEPEMKEELERAGPRLERLGEMPRKAETPGKLVFSENFDRGLGRFKGGAIDEDGAGGSKAMAFPPKGASAWGAFSMTVGPTTTVRFKLKPLCDVSEVQVMFWSEKRRDNYRQNVTGLKKGEWKEVEFKALEARIGWARDGPTTEGDVLNSFVLTFQGSADARMLLDDFEVRE